VDNFAVHDTHGMLDNVGTVVPRQAGFMVPVLISRHLSDVLEVDEDWQVYESFDGRLREVLQMASAALKKAPSGTNPVSFEAVVTSNMTHHKDTLSLLISFDGEAMIVSFPGDE